ncbi:hypothetical protein GJAV_G00276130 [Gymnothorax javanicus]|nr:hypothetical protein GJAV_G00276130 [Gymnothorax javanicus]
MDYDSAERRFKQVRAAKGGGTRSLTIEKTTTVDEIRILAEAIYFPDGHNKSKKLSDYQTELRDFAQCQLDSSSTLQALYDHTKVRLLRLYLCTKCTKDTDQSSRSSTSQFSASPHPASQFPTTHYALQLPASQHSALEPPASQHSALEPPASQHSALEPPASQHSALEPPASQHSALEPPASQHSAFQSPASQHSALEPPASQHSAFESPALQHSALDLHIYINAGTPEVFYRCFVNTSTINSTELEMNLDDTLPVILQCSSPTTPQHTREQKADTAGEKSEDGPTYTSLR